MHCARRPSAVGDDLRPRQPSPGIASAVVVRQASAGFHPPLQDHPSCSGSPLCCRPPPRRFDQGPRQQTWGKTQRRGEGLNGQPNGRNDRSSRSDIDPWERTLTLSPLSSSGLTRGSMAVAGRQAESWIPGSSPAMTGEAALSGQAEDWEDRRPPPASALGRDLGLAAAVGGDGCGGGAGWRARPWAPGVCWPLPEGPGGSRSGRRRSWRRKCCRKERAEPKPQRAATASTGRSLFSSSSRARSTRWQDQPLVGRAAGLGRGSGARRRAPRGRRGRPSRAP